MESQIELNVNATVKYLDFKLFTSVDSFHKKKQDNTTRKHYENLFLESQIVACMKKFDLTL